MKIHNVRIHNTKTHSAKIHNATPHEMSPYDCPHHVRKGSIWQKPVMAIALSAALEIGRAHV